MDVPKFPFYNVENIQSLTKPMHMFLFTIFKSYPLSGNNINL